jgi:hypothetical protein
MMRSIIRDMRAGRALFEEEAELWLFPARSKDGHLIEYWENRKILPKWGEPPRVSRRLFGLSYAAIGMVSCIA